MNFDKKEKFNSVNHLTGLAQCLINRNILIDLRNETSVAGTIINVDGHMNICMENVVYIDQLGKQYPLDNFTIYSKYIRYIHIPEEINMTAALEERIKSLGQPTRIVTNKKATYKEKRAKMYQLQTLAENQML
uniref:Sm domain-containing protein n=1 Tax=Anopheles farauti TaxID=69004 RepID=A0A182QN48_9DIPT